MIKLKKKSLVLINISFLFNNFAKKNSKSRSKRDLEYPEEDASHLYHINVAWELFNKSYIGKFVSR
ncbi:hypothetical protein BpHYR1_042181 [Brachionus plicatilis]|uniref:Uncharacterized protein n=1 Tax=Brachionus plicatilis TaxID=10195 RepID=A0A3M7SFR6_BRAPC|nr:hypothetical protein BpHYR1_042181 [Brachionus plicatilis]